MQVSVESTSGLERRMTVEVPDQRIQSEVDRRLEQLARTTRLKGFRPGKVPMKVVRSRYGDQVRQEVLGEVMQSSFYEAVTTEKLHPAGAPRIEPNSMEAGKDLSFTAIFEVIPEVEPVGLSGVELEKPTAEVEEADVEKMFETLRKQNAEWKTVEREAQEGDRLAIDFHGTVAGEAFKGNEGSNVPVTLGSGRMIAGFEEGLIGAKAGEERTLDLAFPDDYGYKEVAGKPVQFTIKINVVEESHLPDLNDEFAKRFGVEDVDALRREVRANMERELAQHLKNRIKQQVMDKLVELNPIEVPKALVESESNALLEQMRKNMHIPQGKQSPDLSPSMFEEQATRRVSLGLVMAEIIKRNDLKADPARVREMVETVAASYEHPEEVVKWYYGDTRRLADAENAVLEEGVVDWALGQAKVTETPMSFDEVMNPKQ